jgi:anti-sigma factor (TIGR02949 family)
MQTDDDLTCAELVERVTDFLEGAMSPEEVSRVRAHLTACDGCTAHLAQMRTAVSLLQATPRERSPAELEDAIVDMFVEHAGRTPDR